MKKSFQQWVRIAAYIPDYVDNLSELLCPSCKQSRLDYIYCGDEESRVGYGLFWCNACQNGIHISRLLIPEVVPKRRIIYFDDPNGSKILEQLVPKFKRVTP